MFPITIYHRLLQVRGGANKRVLNVCWTGAECRPAENADSSQSPFSLICTHQDTARELNRTFSGAAKPSASASPSKLQGSARDAKYALKGIE